MEKDKNISILLVFSVLYVRYITLVFDKFKFISYYFEFGLQLF